MALVEPAPRDPQNFDPVGSVSARADAASHTATGVFCLKESC